MGSTNWTQWVIWGKKEPEVGRGIEKGASRGNQGRGLNMTKIHCIHVWNFQGMNIIFLINDLMGSHLLCVQSFTE